MGAGCSTPASTISARCHARGLPEIVEGSISFLRQVVGRPDFAPCSFRAGNWLFQPTPTAASVLAENGIKIDSSVFKGGLQHTHRLDYFYRL